VTVTVIVTTWPSLSDGEGDGGEGWRRGMAEPGFYILTVRNIHTEGMYVSRAAFG
jgi:hypothetical protein